MRLHTLAGMVLLMGSGCGPVVSLQDDFAAGDGQNADRLHTPYVAGSVFTIRAHHALPGGASLWSAESDNPDVLAVRSTTANGSDLNVEVEAVSPGTATLTILAGPDRRLFLRQVVLEVKDADRVELLMAGPLVIRPEDVSGAQAGASISVVEHESPAFVVRYFQGAQELAGRGVLSLEGSDSWHVEFGARVGDRHHDQLILGVGPRGASTVTLRTGTRSLGTLRVDSRPETDIRHLELRAQDEAGRDAGSEVAVWAAALDGDGGLLLGARPGWLIGHVDAGPAVDGGFGTPGERGELFLYVLDPSVTSPLIASLGVARARLEVHGSMGRAGAARVSGCAHARWNGRGPTTSLVLVLLACLRGRRRTRPSMFPGSGGA